VSSQPRTLIIINNNAARSRRSWPIIRARLADCGIAYDVYETAAPGDATIHARAALERGCGLIAVVGGDGTLSEAAAGFFAPSRVRGDSDAAPMPVNPDAALAVFPAGTGDDFARNLAGQRAPLAQWIEVFIAHCRRPDEQTTRRVDVLRVRTDNFKRHVMGINASTLGLGGQTAARVAAQGKTMRRLSGELRFGAAALGALAAWRERPVKVQIDSEVVIEGPMNLVAVANARFAGGGMMLSPQAAMADGKLDVVTARGLNRRCILRELSRIHHGGHVANPRVKIVQGRYVSIQTSAPEDALLIEVDGNVCGRTPADYRIMPNALRIVVSPPRLLTTARGQAHFQH
jgi:YegS/Rv2252/BmrU family lipid kinase